MQASRRSSQRNESFQKLFSVPPEEFLYNDFACAVKRRILIQVRHSLLIWYKCTSVRPACSTMCRVWPREGCPVQCLMALGSFDPQPFRFGRFCSFDVHFLILLTVIVLATGALVLVCAFAGILLQLIWPQDQVCSPLGGHWRNKGALSITQSINRRFPEEGTGLWRSTWCARHWWKGSTEVYIFIIFAFRHCF